MGDIKFFWELLIRIGVSILVLLILCKLEGAKQISQLTYFDYIVGITVGSLAGTLCLDGDIPMYYGIVAIVLFMLTSFFISWLTGKSLWARRIFTGRPVFVIAKGEISFKGLKRSRLDINDLLSALRTQGYFDITEINYAIFEPTGNISVMPKAYARPPQVADMGLQVEEDTIKANVIMDGKILVSNLEAFNKNRAWLLQELKRQNAENIKDILLATLDEDGNVNIYYKSEDGAIRTSFT